MIIVPMQRCYMRRWCRLYFSLCDLGTDCTDCGNRYDADEDRYDSDSDCNDADAAINERNRNL